MEEAIQKVVDYFTKLDSRKRQNPGKVVYFLIFDGKPFLDWGGRKLMFKSRETARVYFEAHIRDMKIPSPSVREIYEELISSRKLIFVPVTPQEAGFPDPDRL